MCLSNSTNIIATLFDTSNFQTGVRV